jgi:acetyl-CoA C-acetyltransferase
MSNVPYYLPGARFGYGRGDQKVVDGVVKDGLWDPGMNIHMGEIGERCADKHNVTRADMDRYSKLSYDRATQAWNLHKFDSEIVPIEVLDAKKKPVSVARDSMSGKGLDITKARPAFRKDGRITAGNASSIGDGAAMLVLASKRKAEAMGWKVLATIESFADHEQAPVDFPTAPTYAIEKALQRAHLSRDQIDFVEINEAFAVVTAVNARNLNISDAKLNVYGGAVALGHPIGCSGARIIVTLLSILAQEGGTIGVAGICNGGGGASAVVLRRPKA